MQYTTNVYAQSTLEDEYQRLRNAYCQQNSPSNPSFLAERPILRVLWIISRIPVDQNNAIFRFLRHHDHDFADVRSLLAVQFRGAQHSTAQFVLASWFSRVLWFYWAAHSTPDDQELSPGWQDFGLRYVTQRFRVENFRHFQGVGWTKKVLGSSCWIELSSAVPRGLSAMV